ncbi:MAG TPA: beta-propeller domain-containing protein [Acidimicrobiales bacterium]|jgi:hypothetical protein|nr:beta-propeller domain-containing protein [Acidimicrobiales bacterium]
MRKALVTVTVALVAGLLGVACDPPEDEARRPQRDDASVVDLGELELVGLTTENNCDDLLTWFKKEAIAHAEQSAKAMVAYSATDAGGADAVALATTGDAGGSTAAARAAGEQAAPATTTPAVGEDFSTTNIQEAGVDEPDIVKTDGRRLVALAGMHLRVVDVSGDTQRLVASVPLPGAQSLFLIGDRVLVLGSEATYHSMPGAPAIARPGGGVAVDAIAPPGWARQKTTVTVVDVADPARPTIESSTELEGSFVSARLTGGTARVVLRSSPEVMAQGFAYPGQPGVATPDDALRRNKQTIEATEIGDWVPPYVPCQQVHHPNGFTGHDVVSVVSIDPADPRPGNGASVAGAGDIVYASGRRLYVSTSAWSSFPGPITPAASRVAGAAPAGPTTSIHSFDITDPVTTRYVGSGAVDGTLLNQFSLSEHDGVLRVATTTFATSGEGAGQSESHVVALREEPIDGGTVLKEVGKIGGLGKTERIYAVRFLGDLGYVVTFRQVDPLYVLDLSNPEKPELKGELKIPGYSAYLHPIGDGKLLGIGQDATDEGRRLGAQISLFDVSDPNAPKQLAKHDLRTYGSTAEYDHHAFLWWARTRLVVVPIEGTTPAGPEGFRYTEYRPGAVGIGLEGDSFVEKRRIEHPTRMPITRSIVVGDRLLTLSESGLMASDLASLDQRAWTAF